MTREGYLRAMVEATAMLRAALEAEGLGEAADVLALVDGRASLETLHAVDAALAEVSQ